MKTNNLFDNKLETLSGRIPEGIRNAAVLVTGTLELCWASAQAVFGEKATPEIALEIFDRVIDYAEPDDFLGDED